MRARKLLIVCPDYASHVYPLAAVGKACVDAGMQVTFATGRGMERTVRDFGFDWQELVLGPGNNTGLMRPEDQGAEKEHMRAFFAATRRGPVETLLYQSAARRHDMLHAPLEVHARLSLIIDELSPDLVLIDQLSYTATLALYALRLPFASFHPGHPAGIPQAGKVFGLPRAFPPPLQVGGDDIARLRAACVETAETFTTAFNRALAGLDPHASPVADAFAFTSPQLVLLNYPEQLLRMRSTPSAAHLLGSCLRSESSHPAFTARLNALPAGKPVVYLSFGTFLSARQDALDRVVAALQTLPVAVVLASGTADSSAWEPLPADWIVQPVLPQIDALRHADLAISHGGNNTITESLSAGVPLLVGPFSSDQFDTAADVLAAGVGSVFDPNATEPEALRAQVKRLLDDADVRARATALGQSLRARSGPQHAAELLSALMERLPRAGDNHPRRGLERANSVA